MTAEAWKSRTSSCPWAKQHAINKRQLTLSLGKTLPHGHHRSLTAYQLFTSTEQSSPEELQRLAAFDFRFEDTGCGVSAWPPVPPYKSTQHDSDAAFCLTIVLNQADGLLSLFLPDGALLLERRFPSFPPSLPCSSFVYLSSQRQPGKANSVHVAA